MEHNDERLLKLETLVETGFAEMRLAGQRQERQHEENSRRLEKIGNRIAGLGSTVDWLKAEILRVRQNAHELRGWVQRKVGALLDDKTATKGENGAVSKSDLKWVIGLIVTCIGIGAGVTIWILRLAGKLP